MTSYSGRTVGACIGARWDWERGCQAETDARPVGTVAPGSVDSAACPHTGRSCPVAQTEPCSLGSQAVLDARAVGSAAGRSE